MKILLTGGTGQLGWHLARLLPRIGVTLASARESVDLAQPDSIRTAIRAAHPDVIVNAAAYTAVDRAESEEELAHAINATAPGIMAEEAKRLGALLVHYSSDYVFDGASRKPYVESDTPSPINAYGRSKLAGERAIAAVGGTYLILRTSWLYDTRGHNFLVTMLRAAEKRDELCVVDDQVGNPTWAHSVARATIGVLSDRARARNATGLYHLCAPDSVSRYDFVRRLLALAHESRAKVARVLRAKSVDFTLPASRPAFSALDSTRLREAFGIELPDWETQLKQCLLGQGAVDLERISQPCKTGATSRRQ